MGVDAKHPLYEDFSEDWCALRDLYKGERVVKAEGTKYLPPTPSMILDGMKNINQLGYQTYEGYKKRAVVPDYVREAAEAYVGMLHHKPPVIDLPEQMEPLRLKCTTAGESLEGLLRFINLEQLLMGRVGLHADMPTDLPADAPHIPYIAPYVAESIINWDDASIQDKMALNLVVLNESGKIRDSEFNWKDIKKYRVLQLGEIAINESVEKGTYSFGVFDDATGMQYNPLLMQPALLRGVTLKEIPFVFINSKDLVATPDDSPLVGLAKQCLAIYRGEADYRQALFMTGQDTLVVIGGISAPEATAGESDDALRTGAGSRIQVDIGGDAKYVGVNSEGLKEQREALENDRKRAEQRAGQLIAAKNNQESGQALKTRVSGQTASLKQIALTGAKGLENMLKIIARWMGADPEKVAVKANLEFGDFPIEAGDIKVLTESRGMGAPISRLSIHGLMVKRGYTNMSYDDELEQIQEEDAQMPRVGVGASTVTAEEQLAQSEADREAAAAAKKSTPPSK